MMKRFTSTILAVLAVLQLGAAEIAWQTDLPKAQARAREEKKLVMLNFTGSDWCIYCKELQKNVFSKQAFIEYASTNLVAVEVDFPQIKPLDEAQKQANDALAKKYNIEGYPTLIFLNGDGKKVGELGYESTPKALISKIEKLKK